MDDFLDWLMTASEDAKRYASDWRYHYPTEIEVYDSLDDLEHIGTHTVCGCNPGFGYQYGTEGHR